MKTGMKRIKGLMNTPLFINAAFAQETLEVTTEVCVM